MSRFGYYLRLLGVSIRTSLLTGMQYRADFIIGGLMSTLWVGLGLVPLLVLYRDRSEVAGWGFSSALVVMGLFVIMRGVLDGAINPSLLAMVERIRSGSFDYTLLKPADAQFLVSTSRFEPWRSIDILGGVILLVYALVKVGRAPHPGEVAAGLALFLAAIAVMYSLWILIVAAAFWVVRLDNLSFLLAAVFDAARWPISIFRGAWRVVFTFIIPLALMTSFPAMAILGRLSATTALLALLGAATFFTLARTIWSLAIRSYTSASS